MMKQTLALAAVLLALASPAAAAHKTDANFAAAHNASLPDGEEGWDEVCPDLDKACIAREKAATKKFIADLYRH